MDPHPRNIQGQVGTGSGASRCGGSLLRLEPDNLWVPFQAKPFKDFTSHFPLWSGPENSVISLLPVFQVQCPGPGNEHSGHSSCCQGSGLAFCTPSIGAELFLRPGLFLLPALKHQSQQDMYSCPSGGTVPFQGEGHPLTARAGCSPVGMDGEGQGPPW